MPRHRTIVPRPCLQCGLLFTPKDGRVKRCSRACRDVSLLKSPQEVVCPTCGRSFRRKHGQPQRYCSRGCVPRERRETRVCVGCGKEFTCWPSVKRLHCERSCPRTLEFWTHVDQTGDCWLWTGLRTELGYGRLTINWRGMKAHRRAWELTYGPIPDGLDVCHRCDNPPCVRPEHLFLGTHPDNMADMARKGRAGSAKRPHPVGTASHLARLTDGDVIAIRAARRHGTSLQVLAERYDVAQSTISAICLRHTWSHLP